MKTSGNCSFAFTDVAAADPSCAMDKFLRRNGSCLEKRPERHFGKCSEINLETNLGSTICVRSLAL